MASKVLSAAVSKNDDDTWDFQCPGVQGSKCGDEAAGVGFVSTGWPTKATALDRGREHFDDHLGRAPMTSLEEFRAKHKLGVTNDGVTVSLSDLED